MTDTELLVQMSSVLRMGDFWQARAYLGDFWGRGSTPREAMLAALAGGEITVKAEPNDDLF